MISGVRLLAGPRDSPKLLNPTATDKNAQSRATKRECVIDDIIVFGESNLPQNNVISRCCAILGAETHCKFPALVLNSAVRTIGIIPARYASTRFPAKALALVAGKPLVQWVVEQCQKAASLAEVIVATDDERIASLCRKFCPVEMTKPEHPSGTDRIAEAAARRNCEAIINIQGDEPLIDPTVIDAVAALLSINEMSTAAAPLKKVEEFANPNVIKVVVSAAGRALYFSRRTIPYVRDAATRSENEQLAAFPFLKHLGIYGYRRETLLKLVRLPVSSLEAAEKLEQLRALENGIHIAVARVDYESVGVDVPEDVARVEAILRSR